MPTRRLTSELFETLRCYGYHGFGSGFEMATTGPPKGKNLYCSRACPVGQDCWEVHRRRAAGFFPALAAEFNELAETLQGDAVVREWAARHDGLAPPEVLVMTGNLEDGARVAQGGVPKDRGEWSLTWPLASLTSTIVHAEGD